MSTPAASTKSVASSQPDAQHATSEKVGQNQQPATDGDATTEPPTGNEDYPPQKHAGAVGLGPEYGRMREATAGDKIAGIQEEVVGKITRNHDKVQQGHDRRTGELKRRKFEEEDTSDPIAKAANDKLEDSEKKENEKTPAAEKADNEENVAGNAPPTSVTGKRGPGTHPTEGGAQEQAATTAPEGTEEAEQQRQGEHGGADKTIDESSNKKLRSE